MSSILDLGGTTYTIIADTTETYWQVTDTSTLHNGTLVMQPGAKLLFDDVAGAGFTSVASAITVDIDGNTDYPCEIASVDSVPHHPWSLPALTVALDAVRCKFKGCEGEKSSAWVLTNCSWGDEGYCTVDDVRNLTNISASGTNGVSDARLELFIRNATNEIDERTGRTWDSNTATNEVHDYDGKLYFKLDHYPITTLTSVYFRTGDADWTLAVNDPNDGDYYTSEEDLRNGIIRILEPPEYILQSIKVTYDYGEIEVPYKIRKLCMYLAAIEAYRACVSPGTQNIHQQDIDYLTTQVTELMKNLGELDIYLTPRPREITARDRILNRYRAWQ